MAISVQSVYLIIGDLTRKDQNGGYMDNDEFNRQINYSQQLLYGYYYDNLNETSARNSLLNFQKQADLSPTVNGRYTKPVDYKEKLDASLRIGTDLAPIHFPARDELAMTLSSPVRGPNLDKRVIVGEILGSQINVYPEVSNQIRLRYYSLLPEASRAVVLNVVTQEFDYDPGATVDLEWDEGNLQNFVDLMMLLKGVIIKDSELVRWVAEKENIIAQITTE